MLDISPEQFEALVTEALDSLPPDLGRAMDNVVVLVADESPAGQPELLGLYEGTPLTERDGWYSGRLPDAITVFRLPILRRCDSAEDVLGEVRTTVVHEVAHHFGIGDERLDELGWS